MTGQLQTTNPAISKSDLKLLSDIHLQVQKHSGLTHHRDQLVSSLSHLSNTHYAQSRNFMGQIEYSHLLPHYYSNTNASSLPTGGQSHTYGSLPPNPTVNCSSLKERAVQLKQMAQR